MNSEIQLRPYQRKALSDLRGSVAKGRRAPCLVMATGSGKSCIIAQLLEDAIAKGSRCLFLCNRRELVFQMRAYVEHLPVGTIMAGERRSLMANIQIACVPTLHRRLKDKRVDLPPAELIICDEAHQFVSKSTRDILAAYPKAVVVGFTATPARADGTGLGTVFDDLVLGPSVKELTEAGYLVPARYFAGAKPDMSGVKVRSGDYAAEGMERAVNTEPLVGDVVSNWLRLASDRQTVLFCASRAHARHLHDRFAEHGVAVEYLDGETPKEERAGIIARLHSGETRMVSSIDCLTYGVDIPTLSCAVLARPTKSVTRYLQGVGRILRPCEGKRDCIVLDHACAVDDLGFVDDDRQWTLDDKAPKLQLSQSGEREPKPIECPECGVQFRAARTCPACGHEIPASTVQKAMEFTDAELVEIDRSKRRKNREWTSEEKRRFYGELLFYAREKGYKRGWAANQYRTRLSVWPNAYADAQPVPPCEATRAWITSRMIAFAKRKQA